MDASLGDMDVSVFRHFNCIYLKTWKVNLTKLRLKFGKKRTGM